MRNGLNMGLVIWDHPDDEYDHDQLAANWDALDAHDHSTGRGAPIPTAGLQNNSVTGAVLAPNSVTTNHIVNGTIQSEDLAPGIIGTNQLDFSIFNGITPLGIIAPWFRPNTSVVIPAGWHVCDGSVLTQTQHGWGSIGNVGIPDLRGKFVLGAALSGTGLNPTEPPPENSVGGSNARFFNHSHTVPGHSHVVNAHSHATPWHSHTIPVDGSHNHGIHSRMNAFIQNISVYDFQGVQRLNNLQSLYISGFNDGAGDAALPSVYPPNDGAHSHGGHTGDSSGNTDNASPGTNSVGLTTDTQNPGGDIRPSYVGLLYIIKVKHNA